MQGSAILFSEMIPGSEWEDEFNKWYDEEHIPVRMAAPGFQSGQRYHADGDGAPGYLAVYEMDSPAALATPEYQKIKQQPSQTTAWMLKNVTGFTRYTCEQISQVSQPGSTGIDTPILYAVWFNVPQERLADFDDWYNNDHVPLLMQCKDWQMVRRFNVISGEPKPYNRLALHYLADKRALDSPERKKARETPWRARIASESWFSGTYSIFHRHGDRQLKTY